MPQDRNAPDTRPAIALVTPSLNQGRFIGATIDSVLAQRYQPLQYVIRDGGSTDDTLAILRSYDGRVAFTSEPDAGQADAVNRGVRDTTADIIGYLNSDDVLLPGCLDLVARTFQAHPDTQLVFGAALLIDEDGLTIGPYPTRPDAPQRLEHACYIAQPAAFVRRPVWDALGGLDDRLRFCMDYDFWFRLVRHVGADRTRYIDRPLAAARVHAAAKTVAHWDASLAASMAIARRHAGGVSAAWYLAKWDWRLDGRLQITRPHPLAVRVYGLALLDFLLHNRPRYWWRGLGRPAVSRLRRLVSRPPAGTPRPDDPWAPYPFIDTARQARGLTFGSVYRPLRLQCETVNACNNLCVICAYPTEQRERRVMPLDLFEQIVRDYAGIGGGYLSLTPVTGDVLLDRHLLARLAIVRRYPAVREVGATTNAVMLDHHDDATAGAIVRGFDRLQISVYGLDEEEYRAMTGRPTYARAVASIRRILALRTTGVYLSFRLLKPRTRAAIDAWVADTLGAAAPVPLLSIMTGGYANFTTLDTSRPLPFGASWAPLRSAPDSQCLVPLLSLHISVDGAVTWCPCVGDQPELRLGNVREQSLAELYNSPRVRALWNWRAHGVPACCARCTFHHPLDVLKTEPGILEDPFTWTGA